MFRIFSPRAEREQTLAKLAQLAQTRALSLQETGATVAYLHETRSAEWRLSGDDLALLTSYLSHILDGEDDHLHLFGSRIGLDDFGIPGEGECIDVVELHATQPHDNRSDSGRVGKDHASLEVLLSMERIAEIRDFLVTGGAVLEVSLDERRHGNPWGARAKRGDVPLRGIRFVVERHPSSDPKIERRNEE